MKQDYHRYVGSGRSRLSVFFRFPGYRFMVAKRACEQFSLLNPLGLLARLWFRSLQRRYGFQIPHTCRIGKGLFLGHFGNIVINQGVEVGANCNIAQGVTLGYVSRGSKKGCPVIGDRVWIGANAVVVGKIRIGNDVLIAPLSFVNMDIPDNAVVSGNPATIVNYNGSGGYINNLVP